MKTHIISGAGSGIGQAIAIALSQDSGNQLILIGRNESSLLETKQKLLHTENHILLTSSVTDAVSLKRALTDINPSNLVSVIANAGVGGPNDYNSNDRWDEIIDINVKGTYILGQEALPYLKKSNSEYRHVVIVSSIVAHMGVPMHSAYCTSKSAVLGLMRSWAVEWAANNILVNAICPGWVETQMAWNGIQGIADVTGQSFEQALEQQKQLLPLKKFSKPGELGALTRFLVSGEQISITGEEFQINNGALML